ncbi:transglutaminase family protein [Lichenihabitans sp. Uapishka_5]|uniref:transglutaminase-like domain-containing protein n=1 Tax=Lichenihabitans sp. Uapishka_5 TaxID=3037302 RepID=UPI0029E7D701|nr:transglutaminase family protein [Lichenihabitans sp. Uapishka_5]MDX7953289.1 transglutaminase family protein [Lichenihabitans sp. Uapishka_5]
MLIRYGYDIAIDCYEPTPLVSMMSLHSDRLKDLLAPEVATTSPHIPTTTYHDLYGNLCRRMMVPAGTLTLGGDATIRDSGLHDPVFADAPETPVGQLPNECLIFLLASRYCETDLLSQIAWNRFGSVTPGWPRVQAICDFVNKHIRFDYQQARSTRTAFQAFEEQVGVCRDFAHLAIALCRCMNIPARYINGHLGDIGVPVVDPMDFSAWIEVYLDGRWMTFDPRNNIPRIGRIVVARGRDAADVPMLISFGPHTLSSFKVWTYEVDQDGKAC